MNNVIKITMALSLVMIVSAGCQQKTTTTKIITDSSSSGLSGSSGVGTVIGSDTSSIAGCDGVYRANTTRCYYKNIERITLNGAGNTNQNTAQVAVIGPVLWSSLYNLPGYDQGSFVTDLSFNMRIKALMPYQNEKTVANKYCSNNLSKFTRMKVFFMLRNSVTSITPTFSIEAKLNQFSSKVYVQNEIGNLPQGANDKILEVVGIMTDHRCQIANPPTGCSDGSYWGDIPLVVSTAYPNAPTGCASFQIQYSTDTTYDLP